MMRRIREPFGKAGLIVAVIALIAALAGGAYAASGGLTGKQKKEVKKIAKQFAGKNGEQGPAGQTGPQGQKGDTGSAGANGKDGEEGKEGKQGEEGKEGKQGEEGKSISVFELSPGNEEGCKETGGAKLTNGTETVYVCDGKNGEAGSYPKTLPSERTMKGFWEVQGEGALHLLGSSLTTLSFPLPLASAPSKTVLIHVGGGNTEEEKVECPGTPAAPEATPGIFCLYVEFEPAAVTLKGGGATTYGALLLFEETDAAFGTWAVTAP